uniref:Uncharacterized protein n=1 Tax=Cacopsylla melanoneura TaxID=428564 RepID=A0A8D8UC54_9HEMI
MSNKLTPTKAKMELAVQQTKLARFQAKLQTLVAVIPELADANKLKNFQIRAAGIDSTHLDFQAALNRILELNQYVEEEEQITGDIEQSQAFEDLLYQIKEALLDHAPAPVQAPPAEPVTTTKGPQIIGPRISPSIRRHFQKRRKVGHPNVQRCIEICAGSGVSHGNDACYQYEGCPVI